MAKVTYQDRFITFRANQQNSYHLHATASVRTEVHASAFGAFHAATEAGRTTTNFARSAKPPAPVCRPDDGIRHAASRSRPSKDPYRFVWNQEYDKVK